MSGGGEKRLTQTCRRSEGGSVLFTELPEAQHPTSPFLALLLPYFRSSCFLSLHNFLRHPSSFLFLSFLFLSLFFIHFPGSHITISGTLPSFSPPFLSVFLLPCNSYLPFLFFLSYSSVLPFLFFSFFPSFTLLVYSSAFSKHHSSSFPFNLCSPFICFSDHPFKPRKASLLPLLNSTFLQFPFPAPL